jgi:hypothetical protein
MNEKRKPTLTERLKAAGFTVSEPTGKATVIANPVIDIAQIDTGKRHWLHPAERHRGDPRLAEIRAKHRARHRQSQEP